ncbi:hypothetical protein H5410_038361, partial [Solanum commersonii]
MKTLRSNNLEMLETHIGVLADQELTHPKDENSRNEDVEIDVHVVWGRVLADLEISHPKDENSRNEDVEIDDRSYWGQGESGLHDGQDEGGEVERFGH